MKFVCFKESQKEKLGILSKNGEFIIELSSFKLSEDFTDMNNLIKNISYDDIEKISSSLLKDKFEDFITYSVDEVNICTPIKRPVHDIICVGVNYTEHLIETKEKFEKCSFDELEETVYFSKRAVETIGLNDKILSHSNINTQLDYEVELAVIIGAKGRNIPKDKVEDYIFGYTIMNDISSRNLQKDHLQWFRGKSLDTFTALGPVIIHKNELPLPIEVNISSKVNGELRQNSNTKYMIKDIPSIISEISNGITLEPGDIIATGTPSGVGLGFNPPKFMKPFDVIECEIEDIGILKNFVE